MPNDKVYSQQSGPGQPTSLDAGHLWRPSHVGLPALRVVLSIAGNFKKKMLSEI